VHIAVFALKIGYLVGGQANELLAVVYQKPLPVGLGW
jgi:hypothetical protein